MPSEPVGGILHWDDASGTGLAKDGCCGYRHVARCARCRAVAYADALAPTPRGLACDGCRA